MSMLVSNNIPNSIVDVATAGKDGVYGVVKISDDGSLSITEDGVLSQTAEFVTADPSTTPPTPGLVKVDGVTIKIDSNGIISGASAMNIATPNTAGTVMPDGKSIKILPDGTIYTDGKPPIATTSRLGTVKPDGSSIKVDNDGTLHAEVDTSNLPIFKAETITDKGVNGVVPRPTTKNVDGYLCADGTWGKIEVDPPQAIKDKIEQLITDEKTATLNKDAELNKAVDGIPTGHKTTIAVGDMVDFEALIYGSLKIILIFKAPSNMSVTTTLNKEAVIMRAGGIMIRRSTTEYPKTIKDGDLVIDVKAADFSKYEATGYVDASNIVDGTIYYYTAFPYTSDGVYNENGSKANHTSIEGRKAEIYGFDINQFDDNPDTRVSYPKDVTNASWNPINIILDSDNYNLGDWKNTFFMQHIRPVMLKYDGTVAYELDHNDQSKKLDGTASDISNESYDGNAMVEFPKMYFARWTDSDGKISHVRISNIKLYDIRDKNNNVLAKYECYAHMTEVGAN